MTSFDPTEGEPAWRLLERIGEEPLADVIYRYGEEQFAASRGRSSSTARQGVPIRTAGELAELVRRCVPRSANNPIDPATRTFQALRIAVNDELASVEQALARLPDCLRPGGRIAIISFHSLEDRLVKNAFRDDPRLSVLTRKPVIAGDAEIANNPRARNAKLRVAERVT